MHEFTPWPKTARLFRDIVVTEKLDGTNAAIHISAGYEVAFPDAFELKPGEAIVDGRLWRLSAQSRKRIITPDNDNFGFAAWVYDNAAELVSLLGEGLHFGEWWGRGILTFVSVLYLLVFPIGTILGFFVLRGLTIHKNEFK